MFVYQKSAVFNNSISNNTLLWPIIFHSYVSQTESLFLVSHELVCGHRPMGKSQRRNGAQAPQWCFFQTTPKDNDAWVHQQWQRILPLFSITFKPIPLARFCNRLHVIDKRNHWQACLHKMSAAFNGWYSRWYDLPTYHPRCSLWLLSRRKVSDVRFGGHSRYPPHQLHRTCKFLVDFLISLTFETSITRV